MRKQRSTCTISSYDNLSDCQVSSFGNYSNTNQCLNSDSFSSQPETVDSDAGSSSYYSPSGIDQSAFQNLSSQNLYFQSLTQKPDNANLLNNGFCNPSEPFVPFQFYEDSFPMNFTGCSLTANCATDFNECSFSTGYTTDFNKCSFSTDYTTSFNECSFSTDYTTDNFESSFPVDSSFHQDQQPNYPPLLQFRLPTVTDYGAVTILLRHLIRVDTTFNGSVSVYNFPGQSITTLNAAGSKCYVKHPNGTVLQDGPMVHMMIGNNRFAKITPKGITFSHSKQGLGYFVDESGTKTTTVKYTDFSRDTVMDVFFDGNRRSLDQLEQECYKMALEAKYQKFPDGSELWLIGRIRIKQDNSGEVTVSQSNGRRLIMASPTIRKATVESASAYINIDCYSKNYFTVRKDSCSVTSGFCGLIVQNKNQKAGLDRAGKLVLF